jgi:hypothetical protein
MASNEEMRPWNLVISLAEPEGDMSSEQYQSPPIGAPVIVVGFWCFTRMANNLWTKNRKENIEDIRQQKEMPLWKATMNSS